MKECVTRPPDSLGISEASGFAAELFEEDAVLSLEVFDDSLLMPIDQPATLFRLNPSDDFC